MSDWNLPAQIWPESYCKQMQTYASACEKIKFRDCLDAVGAAWNHIFKLYCRRIAICPTYKLLSNLYADIHVG